MYIQGTVDVISQMVKDKRTGLLFGDIDLLYFTVQFSVFHYNKKFMIHHYQNNKPKIKG
jgi:hypothetical protein